MEFKFCLAISFISLASLYSLADCCCWLLYSDAVYLTNAGKNYYYCNFEVGTQRIGVFSVAQLFYGKYSDFYNCWLLVVGALTHTTFEIASEKADRNGNGNSSPLDY